MVVEMCRACLMTGTGMVQMNETFLNNYNQLNSLNITYTEDMPIYCCKTCFDGANFCIEFREKCIASEQTLKEILFPNCKDEKPNDPEEETENLLEFKKEKIGEVFKDEKMFEYDNKSIDDYLDDCNNYDYEYIEYLEITNEDEKKPLARTPRKTTTSTATASTTPANKLKKDKPKNKLNCVICPKKFEESESLNKHLDNHNWNIDCNICQESFSSLPHLLGHRIQHMPEKQKRCHICYKKFLTAPALEFHYMRIHKLAEKDALIKCKQCAVSFLSGRKLHRHITDVHSEKNYPCKQCSKSFPSKYKLNTHMHNHEMGKIYECDLCTYSTKYSSGVRAHKIRKHTEGRVYCKTCTAAFASQAHLDEHVCKFSKGYVCPICGENIRKSCGNALNRHMLKHSDICLYKCEKCPAKFKSQTNYISHLDKHAGTPRYICEYCQRGFYARCALIKHRRTHTGEKPYVCQICSKGFTGNHNLKVHMKVHGIMNLINKKESTK